MLRVEADGVDSVDVLRRCIERERERERDQGESEERESEGVCV